MFGNKITWEYKNIINLNKNEQPYYVIVGS